MRNQITRRRIDTGEEIARVGHIELLRLSDHGQRRENVNRVVARRILVGHFRRVEHAGVVVPIETADETLVSVGENLTTGDQRDRLAADVAEFRVSLPESDGIVIGDEFALQRRLSATLAVRRRVVGKRPGILSLGVESDILSRIQLHTQTNALQKPDSVTGVGLAIEIDPVVAVFKPLTDLHVDDAEAVAEGDRLTGLP